MSVAYFSETSNVDPAVAHKVGEAISAKLGANTIPQGGRFHAEGPTSSGGWWTFDVWDTEEDSDRFDEEYVFPALRDAGMEPVQRRRLQVSWDTSEIPG